MSERIRSVTVTVTVDTNKSTYEEEIEQGECEELEAFVRRIAATIREIEEDIE